MRILQKSYLNYYLTVCLLIVISGCASQQQSAIELMPASQATKPTEANTAEALNTKTVAPVGFKKFMGVFTPYRVTIQQGNFVSKEMADLVQEGMTREQVRIILGTALLTDLFHADRWDYIFRLLKPNGELITSRMTVHFHESVVAKIERGDLPAEQEYLARITSAALEGGDIGISE